MSQPTSRPASPEGEVAPAHRRDTPTNEAYRQLYPESCYGFEDPVIDPESQDIQDIYYSFPELQIDSYDSYALAATDVKYLYQQDVQLQFIVIWTKELLASIHDTVDLAAETYHFDPKYFRESLNNIVKATKRLMEINTQLEFLYLYRKNHASGQPEILEQYANLARGTDPTDEGVSPWRAHNTDEMLADFATKYQPGDFAKHVKEAAKDAAHLATVCVKAFLDMIQRPLVFANNPKGEGQAIRRQITVWIKLNDARRHLENALKLRIAVADIEEIGVEAAIAMALSETEERLDKAAEDKIRPIPRFTPGFRFPLPMFHAGEIVHLDEHPESEVEDAADEAASPEPTVAQPQLASLDGDRELDAGKLSLDEPKFSEAES